MTTGWLDRTRRPSAGRVLAVVSVVPVLVLAGWLLAGLPLLLLGWFRPLVAVPLGLAAVALLCRYGLRRLPETVEATAWQVTGVVAVALASGIFNGLLHGEQLIVRRDPATYAQYGVWLARHGALPIPFQEGLRRHRPGAPLRQRGLLRLRRRGRAAVHAGGADAARGGRLVG